MTHDAGWALLILGLLAFHTLIVWGFGVEHGRVLERRHGRVQRSLRLVRETGQVRR